MQDAVQPLQFGRRAFCFIWLLMSKLELPECFNNIVMTIIRDEQAEHYSDLELRKLSSQHAASRIYFNTIINTKINKVTNIVLN